MHATYTTPARPHPPALAVWPDAGDPPELWFDTSDGGNVVDLPVDCTADDIDRAMASLGCRLASPWHQTAHRMWTAVVTPVSPL